jgi:hypothetical protein
LENGGVFRLAAAQPPDFELADGAFGLHRRHDTPGIKLEIAAPG